MSALALLAAAVFHCRAAYAIDGDTFVCRDGTHVRLAGIDAPELPGHCRQGRRCAPGDPFASRDRLAGLLATHPSLRCVARNATYGRVAAWCRAGRVDLSCAMVTAHSAIRWERYGGDAVCGSADGRSSALASASRGDR